MSRRKRPGLDDVLNCKRKPICPGCPYDCMETRPKRRPILDAKGLEKGNKLGKITYNGMD